MTVTRTAFRPGLRWCTLADQALSSVSNVLAVVLVARSLGATDFGRFTLGYGVLTLVLALCRAYFGTRVSLVADPRAARELTGDLVAALVLLTPLLSCAVLVASALTSGTGSPAILLAIAGATPVVCAQDVLRFGAVSSGRPWAALASDATWVALMLMPVLPGMHLPASLVLWWWWAAAAVALLVALTTSGVRPRWRGGVAQVRGRHPVGESLTVGSIVTTLATFWVLFLVSRVIDPSAAGSLRGASTAMGPVNVLLAFTAIGLTPALVARTRQSDLRFCAGTSAALVGVTLLWGTVLLAVPPGIGGAAFGDSWPGIRAVLPWTVAEYAFLALAAGTVLGLKVRHLPAQIMRGRGAGAGVTVLAGSAAAVLLVDPGAVAAALVLAALAAAAMGWGQLLRSVTRGGSPQDPAGAHHLPPPPSAPPVRLTEGV